MSLITVFEGDHDDPIKFQTAKQKSSINMVYTTCCVRILLDAKERCIPANRVITLNSA